MKAATAAVALVLLALAAGAHAVHFNKCVYEYDLCAGVPQAISCSQHVTTCVETTCSAASNYTVTACTPIFGALPLDPDNTITVDDLEILDMAIDPAWGVYGVTSFFDDDACTTSSDQSIAVIDGLCRQTLVNSTVYTKIDCSTPNSPTVKLCHDDPTCSVGGQCTTISGLTNDTCTSVFPYNVAIRCTNLAVAYAAPVPVLYKYYQLGAGVPVRIELKVMAAPCYPQAASAINGWKQTVCPDPATGLGKAYDFTGTAIPLSPVAASIPNAPFSVAMNDTVAAITDMGITPEMGIYAVQTFFTTSGLTVTTQLVQADLHLTCAKAIVGSNIYTKVDCTDPTAPVTKFFVGDSTCTWSNGSVSTFTVSDATAIHYSSYYLTTTCTNIGAAVADPVPVITEYYNLCSGSPTRVTMSTAATCTPQPCSAVTGTATRCPDPASGTITALDFTGSLPGDLETIVGQNDSSSFITEFEIMDEVITTLGLSSSQGVYAIQTFFTDANCNVSSGVVGATLQNTCGLSYGSTYAIADCTKAGQATMKLCTGDTVCHTTCSTKIAAPGQCITNAGHYFTIVCTNDISPASEVRASFIVTLAAAILALAFYATSL